MLKTPILGLPMWSDENTLGEPMNFFKALGKESVDGGCAMQIIESELTNCRKKPNKESICITEEIWTALTEESGLFSFSATTTIATDINENTCVELINDNAIDFAQFGFQILGIDGQNITFVCVKKPNKNVNLTIEVGD